MRVSLQDAMKKKLPVEVVRNVDGLDSIDGFILAMSADWLLIADIDDGIRPDGFELLRRDTVKSLRHTVYLDFRRKITKREGLLAPALEKPDLPITGITSILGWLFQHKRFSVFRIETPEGWRRIHGRIVEQGGKTISVVACDGAGRWEKKNTRISPGTITSLRFGSHYLRMFEKYAGNPQRQIDRPHSRRGPTRRATAR